MKYHYIITAHDEEIDELFTVADTYSPDIAIEALGKFERSLGRDTTPARLCDCFCHNSTSICDACFNSPDFYTNHNFTNSF